MHVATYLSGYYVAINFCFLILDSGELSHIHARYMIHLGAIELPSTDIYYIHNQFTVLRYCKKVRYSVDKMSKFNIAILFFGILYYWALMEVESCGLTCPRFRATSKPEKGTCTV